VFEAVAALINSKSKEAALAQQKIASGALSKKINEIKDILVSTLALVENEIDISEELMEKQTVACVKTNLIKTKDLIGGLLKTYKLGKMLFEGLDVIIVGETNVGKSTLFNALVKKDVSIVNQEPGTTRNLIESGVLIGGAVVRVVDTAGVRKTNNPVEKEGLDRAKRRAKKADLVLHLIDDPAKAMKIKKTEKKLIILTKSDLRKNVRVKKHIIHISAKAGLGVDGLLDKVKESLGIASLSTDTTYLSTLRQKRALSLCGKPVERAIGSTGLSPIDLSTGLPQRESARFCLNVDKYVVSVDRLAMPSDSLTLSSSPSTPSPALADICIICFFTRTFLRKSDFVRIISFFSVFFIFIALAGSSIRCKTRSAFFARLFALSKPSFSTGLFVLRTPAVSTTRTTAPPINTPDSIKFLVVPGSWLTIETSFFTSALNSVDFPTFVSPTIITSRPSNSIFPSL
jgi:small GTP-binding protein